MGRHPEPIEPRFWAKVDKTDGCWLWTGAKTSRGYGVIQSRGHTLYVHRLSLEWSMGKLRPGEMACHHCDTPACVRPDHLFVGNVATNAADMVAKGRSYKGPRTLIHRQRISEAKRCYYATHTIPRKTHCIHGHALTPDNLYVRGNGQRHCRTCVRAQQNHGTTSIG